MKEILPVEELHDLQVGDETLPPRRSFHGAQEIIPVHHHMHLQPSSYSHPALTETARAIVVICRPTRTPWKFTVGPVAVVADAHVMSGHLFGALP